MNATASTLTTLFTQVRTRTLAILTRADPASLTWTPKGTVNHLTWHAGHVLWVQDAICITSLTAHSQLPADWPSRFGMESNPATDPLPWPTRETLVELLTTQLETIKQILADADPAALAQMHPPENADPGLGWYILHGFHDEAIHQGEMRLLLKLWKAR